MSAGSESESGIEFDFGSATTAIRHDSLRIPDDGNRQWMGVDFRIQDGELGWIWLEVKNFDLSRAPPRFRGGNQSRFVSSMRSGVLADEIRSKFWGTTAFLAWTGRFEPVRVTYVVLVQPPRAIDKALLVTLATRIHGSFPTRQVPWTHRIEVAVVELDDWNAAYPHLPARRL